MAGARPGGHRTHQRAPSGLRAKDTNNVTERRPARGSRHRNEKMGAKIRDFTLQKLPYILVVGDKEAETGAVSLRVRGQGDKGSMPLEDFVTRARSMVDSKATSL